MTLDSDPRGRGAQGRMSNLLQQGIWDPALFFVGWWIKFSSFPRGAVTGSWMSPLLGTPSSKLWPITSRSFLGCQAPEDLLGATLPLWTCFFGGVARTQALTCSLAGWRVAVHVSLSLLLPQTLPATVAFLQTSARSRCLSLCFPNFRASLASPL